MEQRTTVFSITITGTFPSPKKNSESGERSFSAKNVAPTKVKDYYSSSKKSFNSNDKEFLATVKEIISNLEESHGHIEEMEYTPPVLSLTVSFISKTDADLFRKLIYGKD